jgi:hypothetical protein
VRWPELRGLRHPFTFEPAAATIAIRGFGFESQRLAKKPWVLKNSLMTLDKFSRVDSNAK